MRACFFTVALLGLVACGEGEDADPVRDGGGGGTTGCGAGEVHLEDGTCRGPGVPADACGAGFLADETGGCIAVLPAEPCPPGTMAVPGETECRSVAPCGAGTWGDIPVEADTQFVDPSYAGADGDGSKTKPWTTIADALDAANAGAIIAIAEGSYTGDVVVQSKSVRLWGRCPELVELVGTSSGTGTVFVREGGGGTEIHDLSITGPTTAVVVTGAEDVVADRVWLHDLTGRGFNVQDTLGPASATLSRSLVEGTHEMGVFVGGSPGSIVASAVRDTEPRPDGRAGRGIAVEDMEGRAAVTVTSCVVERNRESGIFIGGSDATVEATVIRDTLENTVEAWGRGLTVQSNPAGTQRANVTLRTSLIERSHQLGVAVFASELTVDATVVRDTQLDSPSVAGRGFNIQAEDNAGTSTAIVRSSLVEGSLDVGLFVVNSDLTLEGVLVRATHALPNGTLGDGIAVFTEPIGATLSMTAGRVEGSARAGISSFGADVSLANTRLECNGIDLDGEIWMGTGFALHDLDGNRCGCGDSAVECKVLSSNLAPPAPVPK